MRIYLSPSNQSANKYCVGNTNEKVQCEAIASKVKTMLENDYNAEGIMATLSLGINKNERPLECKNKGCGFYLAIHTNAGSPTASGAVGLYHPKSPQSKTFAENAVKELGSVCSIKSNRATPVQSGMNAFDGVGYGEVRSPMEHGVPSCLLEIDFHDNAKTTQWIIENHDVIAGAIVKALVSTFGISKKSASVPIPETPPQTPVTPQKLYRVQVGAYAVRANAEAMLAKLKSAGYDAFITQS